MPHPLSDSRHLSLLRGPQHPTGSLRRGFDKLTWRSPTPLRKERSSWWGKREERFVPGLRSRVPLGGRPLALGAVELKTPENLSVLG